MPDRGPDGGDNLKDIIRQLRTVDDALFERRLNATTVDDRARLRAESHAVSAKMERLQGLLFAQASRDFSAEVTQIDAATADVNKAIKQINDLNGALGGIANLLGIVDSVIGLFA